jgi:hypothetical protein
MSEQHEDHVDEPEVVPVEVYEEPADEPYEGDETVEAEQEEQHQPQDWQEERYERAATDPEYAEQQAIEVDDDDKGPAWEYGSLAAAAALEGADDLPVDGESDDDDDSEEV